MSVFLCSDDIWGLKEKVDDLQRLLHNRENQSWDLSTYMKVRNSEFNWRLLTSSLTEMISASGSERDLASNEQGENDGE